MIELVIAVMAGMTPVQYYPLPPKRPDRYPRYDGGPLMPVPPPPPQYGWRPPQPYYVAPPPGYRNCCLEEFHRWGGRDMYGR
jgi:hypothetical protein